MLQTIRRKLIALIYRRRDAELRRQQAIFDAIYADMA